MSAAVRRDRPAATIAVGKVHDVAAARRGAQHERFARVVQRAEKIAMHLHARRHVVVGAEGVGIHETDDDEISAGREQDAGGEGEINALGELHAREIQRDAAAGVLQFHVLVAAGRGIEHDLGDAQKILQVRDVVRRRDHKLLRQRPLAVAARDIGVQHARPVTAADAHEICGQGDVRVEGGNRAALPRRFDFIFLRLGRAVNRRVGAGDFRHAPA